MVSNAWKSRVHQADPTLPRYGTDIVQPEGQCLRLVCLLRCAEERSESEKIGKNPCGRNLRAGARSSYYHRLSVVTRSLKTDNVVAACKICESVIEWISTQ